MFEYWFMFPVSVCIATVAMATGVGGAAMFTPFFFLVLDLPAAVAVGTGLFIEVFGFGSGLFGFARRRLIAYDVGVQLLCFTVPAAIAGAMVAGFVPDGVVMSFLAGLLVVLGAVMVLGGDTTVKDDDVHTACGEAPRCFSAPEQRWDVWSLSAVGGALAGMVSTGIGELNDYVLLRRYEMHGPVAAGTSVFVVAVTVLVGSVAHAYAFFTQHSALLDRVLRIVVFAVPGVLVGAQSGVWAAERVPAASRDYLIGGLFFVLAVVTVLHI